MVLNADIHLFSNMRFGLNSSKNEDAVEGAKLIIEPEIIARN